MYVRTDFIKYLEECLYNAILQNVERCPSGRRCRPGTSVWGNPPRVRIPSSQPVKSINFYSLILQTIHLKYMHYSIYVQIKAITEKIHLESTERIL